MGNNLFYVVVFLIGILFSAVTCVLGISKRFNRFMKYIPTIAAGMAAFVFLSKTMFFSEDFESLGYLILTLISAIIFALSLFTALAMEVILARKRKREQVLPDQKE